MRKNLINRIYAYQPMCVIKTKEKIMKLVRLLKNIARREEGQTLAEYALILVLIAVVVIAAVTLLGEQIQGVLQSIANAL